MAASPLSVVIHGHFYQPPRDDPWMETVEAQPSAAPFHDWNERITEECYRAVVAARIPGQGGRIADIVNTLDFISFNFGPTLLEWMEGAAPQTYREILQADARSVSAGRLRKRHRPGLSPHHPSPGLPTGEGLGGSLGHR